MDDIARYNRHRWEALVDAGALFSRPRLDLTPASARAYLDPAGLCGDVGGLRVLCLAAGGGQQSAAFALLGTEVTVLDLSPAQIERDREVAEHYGVQIKTVEGDMRDLSRFAPASFDIVWHPYSINFVPDAGAVFAQVARVLRPGGLYHLSCANPFHLGLSATDWDGTGYPLHRPYINGAEVVTRDEGWVYDHSASGDAAVPPVREFRHSLSTLVNGLSAHGLVIFHLDDMTGIHPDPHAAPGTWDHFVAVAPPWLAFWTRLLPVAVAL